MTNLTHYSDEYLMGIIAKVGGNHHRCTANVQLSLTDNQWYLNIWQDCSNGWDDDERVIYSEPVIKESDEISDELIAQAETVFGM